MEVGPCSVQGKQVGCYFGPRSRLRGSWPGGVLFRKRVRKQTTHCAVSPMEYFKGGL